VGNLQRRGNEAIRANWIPIDFNGCGNSGGGSNGGISTKA